MATTPLLHTQNILGSPLTTAGGLLGGGALYLGTQGITWPTDTQGWITLIISVIVAVAGALVKQGGTQPPTA